MSVGPLDDQNFAEFSTGGHDVPRRYGKGKVLASEGGRYKDSIYA